MNATVATGFPSKNSLPDAAPSRFVSRISYLPPDDVVSSAWLEHGAFAFWLIETLKPRTYVELGTHSGYSYFVICQAVRKLDLPTKCYAIDTWTGDEHAGFYDDRIYHSVAETNEKYQAFSTLVRSTFANALEHFPDGSIDLLHIDGRHFYEDVKTDFATWRPKLTRDAVVLFHDTNVRERNFGVWRLFEELKKQHLTFEFNHGHGLGVLAIGDVPHTLRALFECSEEEAATARAIYAQLGASASQRWAIKEQSALIQQQKAITQQQKALIQNKDQEFNERISGMSLQLETLQNELEEEVSSHQNTRESLRITNFHLGRLNASGWTKIGLAVDALLLLPLRLFGIDRDDRDRHPVSSESDVAPDARDASKPSSQLEDSSSSKVGPANLDRRKNEIVATADEELESSLKRGDNIDFTCSTPQVSVIIVLWNKAMLTLQCLRALKDNTAAEIEVIVVDNGSSDKTAELIDHLQGIKIIKNETNLGFVAACNQGAEVSAAPYLLLLNNDACIRSDAISSALQTLRVEPNVGVVGGLLVLPDGTAQEAGSIVWADGSCLGYGRGWNPRRSELMFRREVDYCSGAFLLTPKKLWTRLGGLNEAFSPAYYEEVDYCMRVRAEGLKVIYEPNSVIDHFEFGSTSGSALAVDLMQKNRKIFRSFHSKDLMSAHLPALHQNVLHARAHRAAAKKRLLIIDGLLPLRSQGAGFPRACEMVATAVALGWDLTLYPLHQLAADWTAARREISSDVEIICDKDRPSLRDFIADRIGYYDIVVISRPDTMKACLPIFAEGLFNGTQIVYDAEALFAARKISQAEMEGHPIAAAEADRLINEELALAEHSDVISCASGAEAALFRKALSKPVFVISHTSKALANVLPFEQRSGFLFVGRLFERDAPNWVGLAWFIKECWPLIRSQIPDAALTVVGKIRIPHEDFDAPGVEVVGEVEDLEPFYRRARVFVAPIRFAAGIPLKIVEAAFASVPCVGTCLMAQLLGWTSEIEMMAEDDPSALAASAARLHEDKAVWTAVRDAGSARAAAEFGQDAFRKAMEDLLG